MENKMIKRPLFTQIIQTEVKILEPNDWEGYDYNNPGDKWELVELPDGTRMWCGVYPYTFTTPKIEDYSKVGIRMTRQQYIDEFAIKYIERHPDRTIRYAKRQARLRFKTRQKQMENYGYTKNVQNMPQASR
jgi:hypothetical protein